MKVFKVIRPTTWALTILLIALLSVTQLQGQESVPVYAEVNLTLSSPADIDRLRSSGIDLDHFHPEIGKNRLVVRADELPMLGNSGLGYTVTEPNLAKAIEARNIADAKNYVLDPSTKTTAGFELGSMGGFYTYAEVLQQLDEMYALYPNLITQRFSIGTTGEGRTIWAVKISDNPNSDESAAEAPVYFDALHHAREPASMATVINFMFHLLENYGSDPGLSYVVENREIFIVPVVNPDGYEYNRQTNPNGGGFWRKNRRVNSGTSCRGVDINRNYAQDWAGASSSNRCSDSYHGTAPFSEPESQAIRDFTTAIGAPIAYTTHTSGGFWLGPDFSNNRSDFAIHAELMNDCMQENEYIHGDANIILGYVSGTTQGWMYESLGSLSWTPEIGTTGFWPSIPEIVPLVNQQIKPYEYACWVAGALADYQGFTVTSSQGLSSAAPLDFDITIKNKGLTRTAQGVNVVVTTDNPGVTASAGSQAYGNIASRAFATNSSSFSFNVDPSVPAGTVVTFFVEVSQDGVVSDADAFQLTVGEPTILFSDDAESGSGAWSNGGSGSTWQTSTEDAYTGNSCFVDSRISHAAGNRNFSTNSAISLAGTTNPRLEFAAKWSMYQKYTRLQISVNGGGWSNLSASGMGTANGGPAYVGNERWTYQVVDLSAYVGQSVRFRFANFGGGTNPDGFYFDDFRVVDYETAPTCNDGVQNGSETGVDCGGPDCAACPTCDDGVQNGSETGVDCGGPDCAACPTCDDGIQNGSETGVDCGGPDCAACPTCDDGIQNGSETGVDCGGPDCAACITCDDGIQNGLETGVDCGGPDCAACITCDDGVQNGLETGVDCGGPDCAACPTCDDGIQNGSETGVDCGGPDCAACPTCDDGIQNGSETGVDCGGPDCAACITCDDGIQNGLETGVDCGGPDCAACPTCDDGVQNGSETGVDCGGPDCAACITCDDGIQNGAETGVDCGGPDCAACPTCDDGIQNGSETGVDCGGPDCAACPTCDDGVQNGSETGVDCGGPDCAACITCDDGIQNGAETGVDCGGPDCAACPTCDDGIQNGSETGVDCGGPDCAACPTCDDGIQNGSETGVDCGGPDCAACPTCDDGFQNGSETGVDCGGPDCAACPTCDDGIQNGSETGVDCGGPDCAACATCDDGMMNGSETGVDCGGPDCAACPTCDDGIQNGDETGVDCGGSCPTSCPVAGLQLEYGVLSNIGEGWVTVPLANTYNSMVVVATVVMPSSAQVPVVTRVRNASGNSFELRLQTTTSSTSATYAVHYVVVEEGVYTTATDGIKMEAVKFTSGVTAENNNWAFEGQSYQQSYSSPVVVGQVMTFNDADWSVFWASANGSRTTPPTTSSFAAGKNVGEDPDNTRANETVGYLVIEAGSGTVANAEYTAGLGSDIVRGITNTSSGFAYGLSGLTGAQAAVVSAAAMDGNNGGWPVLYGSNPFSTNQLVLAFDEDVARDTERSHTTEQVAYFAFGAAAGAGNCNDGIQNGSETGVDCGGPDCAACPTCDDGIQNGSETGVDCGGPDCAACPTCDDGIQNGSETGVDCGGPDCAACPTCDDGIQNGSETGVDCGGPDCTACPTCDDGIQNGSETGVDCGGPDCAACPTCDDGIQNGSETGVDCGGPDCAACDTCDDGILNGSETGVDCGGPDCAACPTCDDGIQNGSETGVDCGGPDCAACPTCDDGIQNGSETGVDCGGPDCAACPTCDDGIQNGSETGVDCGGPDCAACPTCDDGIQNGSETGVDCGGPDCAACPTCDDGIQNGSETGVDCGGPDCAACPTCDDGIQNGSETGVDCGGPDCAACPVNYCSSSAGSTFYEHIASVTIAGVTNTSGDDDGYGDFTGVTIPLSGTVPFSLTPGFAGSSYNEGWVVWIDYNADGDFTDAGERALELFGSSTVNGSVIIPGGLTGTSRMRIQMRYNGFNGSSCGTYAEGEVEDYTVDFGDGTRRLTAPEVNVKISAAVPVLELFPNPARTDLTVRIPLDNRGEEAAWTIIDATGKVVRYGVTPVEALRSGLTINVQDLAAGIYYLSLNSSEVRTTKRFIVQP